MLYGFCHYPGCAYGDEVGRKPFHRYRFFLLALLLAGCGIALALSASFGKNDQSHSTVDLVGVVRALEGAVRKELGSGVSLQLICESGLPPVVGDAGLIGMSLMVLARNAREALGGCGNVEIDVRRAREADLRAASFLDRLPDYAMIAFRDDGPGMSEDVVERIFDPFFSTKPLGAARGLGLSAVRSALHDHGGWIAVETEEGAGAVFLLVLPIASGSGEGQQRDIVAPRRPVVVIVDDREPALRMLARACTEGGFDVRAFTSAVDALAFVSVSEQSVDVVVTDIVMPEIDGIELAARMRAIRPGVQVIFISGYYESPASLGDIGGWSFPSRLILKT